MKKVLTFVLVLVIILSFCACGVNGETQNPTQAASNETTTAEPVELTEKEQIEKILRDRIIEKYTSTDIDKITINDNAGTEEEGDYIALVYLTWNVKNPGELSKKMLNMFSSDLAFTLGEQNETVKELAIFWTVPYLNDNAKCSYERTPNGFAEMDMVWGNAFA